MLQTEVTQTSQVTNALKKLGFSASKLGFYYMRECIILLINEPSKIDNVISEVAAKSSLDFVNVKKAIKKSIKETRTYGDRELWNKIFSKDYTNGTLKISTLDFISILTDKIKTGEL